MDGRDWPALGKPGGRPPAAFPKLGVARSPGGERLLQAAARSLGQNPECLTCVGRGPPNPALKQSSRTLRVRSMMALSDRGSRKLRGFASRCRFLSPAGDPADSFPGFGPVCMLGSKQKV